MNRVQKFANQLPKKAILNKNQTAEVIGGIRFFVSKSNPLVDLIVSVYEYLGADVDELPNEWCIDW